MSTKAILPEYWRDLFTDEMRLRGASGAEIGEAMATVESHCAEAKLSPSDAFGDPVVYAQQLRRATNPRPMLISFGATWLGLFAMMVSVGMPWRWDQRSLGVSWGTLTTLLVGIGFWFLIRPFWRLQRRSPGRGFAAMVGFMFVFQLALQSLRDWTTIAFHAPVPLLWGLGLVAAIVGTILAVIGVRDRVIDPRTGQTPNYVPAAIWWILAASPVWVPGALLFFRWLAHR